MIIKLIAKRPLNPSIKFAPLIINKKHSTIKIVEKIWLCNHKFKKIKSILTIFIGKIFIKIVKEMIININLILGLILILISSK